MHIRDTAQHGKATAPGARVCDPPQPTKVGAAATREWVLVCEGCCGSQTRAPLNHRGLPRLGGILIKLSSVATGKPIVRQPAVAHGGGGGNQVAFRRLYPCAIVIVQVIGGKLGKHLAQSKCAPCVRV